ncbi:MAG: hypothetical protein ACLFMO_07830 [Eubacteriales bacterium]
MSNLVSSIIVTVFTFGTAIFYVLACIERSVMLLSLNPASKKVNDEEARFVHTSLKRLIPLLPPSNGFVILFGTISLIYQAVIRNWDIVSVLLIVIYCSAMLYIIFIGKIAEVVKEVRSTSSTNDIIIFRFILKAL